jgi:hypothetical protein
MQEFAILEILDFKMYPLYHVDYILVNWNVLETCRLIKAI